MDGCKRLLGRKNIGIETQHDIFPPKSIFWNFRENFPTPEKGVAKKGCSTPETMSTFFGITQGPNESY